MHSLSLLFLALAPLGVLSQRISTDATCGGAKSYTCLGSAFGSCCSQYGWCGNTKNYCGVGCNPSFGTCISSSSSSRTSSAARTSSTPSASAQLVSTNARCGPSFGGRTCLGSVFGDCCSQYSYCGSTNAYCAAQTCQKGYGKCNVVSSSARSLTQTSVLSSAAAIRSSSTLVLSSGAQSSSTAPVNGLSAQSSSTLASSTTQTASSSSTQVLSSSSRAAFSSSASSPSPSPSASSSTMQAASSTSFGASSSRVDAGLPTSQAVSSSSIAVANIVLSPSSTPSPTTSQARSFSASQAVASSTPDVVSSSSAQAVPSSNAQIVSSSSQAASTSIAEASPSVPQATSPLASEPASVTSIAVTESPSAISAASQFVLSDASAFFATYTFDDSALPTPVDVGTAPITSGISQTPPNLVKSCIIDPTKSDITFTLLDPKDRIPIVKQAANDNLLGPIQAPAGEPDLEHIDDVKLTSYSFVAGTNGLFDIVTNTNPRQYIARLSDGSVGLTEQSSGANNLQMATTIFDVTCEGRVTVRIGSQHYTWALNGNNLVMAAAEGTPETMYTVPDVAVPKRRRRNIWQQGVAPRCDLSPQPLEARVFPGARETHPDQCGTNGLNVQDPNFATCCSQLSIDYDNCAMSFEDANNRFYTCMRGTGCRPYATPATWRTTFGLYVGCMQSARYYYTITTEYAGQVAFYQANSERCKCFCGTPYPDACTVNNSLQCLNVLSTDKNNCGACGRKCPDNSRCVGGTCKCPVDQCSDRCVTLASHPQNCGQCGRVSPSGYCVNGQPWFPPACSRGEGFTNGGFASGTLAWTTTAGATARFNVITDSGAQDADQKAGLLTFNPGTNISIKLNALMRMCPNVAYALKFQMRRPAGAGVCSYSVYVAGELKTSGQILPPTQGGVAWQPVTANVGPYAGERQGVSFKVPDLFASFVLDLVCTGGGPSYVLVDQFSLLPGSVDVSSVASSTPSSSIRSSNPSASSSTSPTTSISTTPSASPTPTAPACPFSEGFTGGHFNQGISAWTSTGTGARLSVSMDSAAEDTDKLVGTLGVVANARISTLVLACTNTQYNWKFQIKRSAGLGTCSYIVTVGGVVKGGESLPTYNQGGGTFKWVTGVAGPFTGGTADVVDKGSNQLAVNFSLDFTCEGGAPGSNDGLNYMLMDQFSILPI